MGGFPVVIQFKQVELQFGTKEEGIAVGSSIGDGLFQNASCIMDENLAALIGIVQNILTTLPCSGRQGKTEIVAGSGCKNKSECVSSQKPAIAEASMAMPYLNARSNSWGIMEIFL